ncbi:SDR family NAD(P)-dependent oxidoreductase [Solicola gregarius]|uniref:SDR family NAD(P)-dependent oxidoreductase n=1 Tax=Solicola gregarius TaxID=2908642 RepID=UPI00230618B2|nr:SDR family NAD(P)-dependent oxidoreductase [Solicola gregarius]
MTAVDISDPTAISHVLDLATDHSFPLRIVVNCADIAPSARILSRHGVLDLSRFASVINVNLAGAFNALALAAERMAQADTDQNGQRGVITNTAASPDTKGRSVRLRMRPRRQVSSG